MKRVASRLLLFDLETTGFSRSRDRIMEFSIYDPFENLHVLDTLVNPMRRVPRRGTKKNVVLSFNKSAFVVHTSHSFFTLT